MADGVYADGVVHDLHGKGRHLYLECKVLSPLTAAGLPSHADALEGVMAGLQHMVQDIHNKYEPHLRKLPGGSTIHSVSPLIHDTFGAIHIKAMSVMKDADGHVRGRDVLDADPSDPDSSDCSLHWSAPSFKSRSLQTISIAVHTALAGHIHRYVHAAVSSGTLA